MLFKGYNKSLINDREKTYLTVAAVAADTTLTVASTDLAPAATSSNTWSDNDYMIIGEIGQEGTEVMQVAAAVTSATSMTIDREGSAGGCRLPHPIGTPVYRIDYNQVRFYRNTTDTSTGSTLLSTQNLQPDDEFTRYDDGSNTTGYGFIRFYNATSSQHSAYSDGVNYEDGKISSSRDPRTLWSIRKKVRKQLDEDNPNSKLTDEMIDNAVNDKQREIAHIRLWTFYEAEKSLSLVANQFAYDIPATVQMIHGIKVDTTPIDYSNKNDWDIQHIDSSDTSDDITDYTIWNRQIWLFPRPSSSAASTTLNADITAAATTIYVGDGSSFNRGDYYRFIIDDEVIYSTDLEHDLTELTADVALADVTINVGDTTDFPASGTIVIDDDVITYTGKTATTFTGCAAITAVHTSGDSVHLYTFNTCLRGQEGTTAATHTAAATITERDIVYTCHLESTDLIDTQDRTAIPEPDVLVLGTTIDLAPFVGKTNIIPIFEGKYNKRIKDLEDKYSSKQTAQFGRIRDVSERNISSPWGNSNLYPRNINT